MGKYLVAMRAALTVWQMADRLVELSVAMLGQKKE
jgi:hypothetical protein